MKNADVPKPSKDPLEIVGSVVAEKYQIISLAGEGGFSLVYKAKHLIWQQFVAIKFFVVLENAKPELREQLLGDFIREGKLMSELSSRSAAIVQARDIGKLESGDGWIPYMVLEWLDGQAFDALLLREFHARKPPRTLREALTLLEPIAAALDLAHRSHVAHRDLKPANIMLVGDATSSVQSCKLLDFGIAKVMSEQVEQREVLELTGQQITAFTPNYGAPEQFSRQYGATGPWTDVFAMALIFVEILRGGLRALQGDTFFDLGLASRNPVRPTPAKFGIVLSDELEAVFAKALAIAPGDRHATMGELWIDLHQHVFPDAAAWQRVRTATSVEPPSALRGNFGPVSLGSVPARLQPNPALHSSQPLQVPTTLPASRLAGPQPGAAGRKKTSTTLVVALLFTAVAVVVGVVIATRPSSPSSNATATASQTPTQSPSASVSLGAAASAAGTEDGPCPKGMNPVNGGTFTMGSNDKDVPLASPAHQVSLDTFCLDVHEVTVARYRGCVAKGACEPADTKPTFPKAENETEAAHAKFIEASAEFCNWGATDRETHPINCVDAGRAEAYCRKLGFDLPTEAQWELAARGTDGRKFPWGDDGGDHTYMNAAGIEWREWLAAKDLPSPNSLMYEKNDGYAGTAPVGHYPRAQTQSGQLDMVGNVWEWTRDWYAIYQPDAQTNPKGPALGNRKAIRGGGFNGEYATWVNPAARYHQLATASVHVIGFRCAATIKSAR